MRLALFLVLLGLGLAAASRPAGPQGGTPLVRRFSAGSATRYHVRLTLRSSLAGEQAIKRGGRAYVHGFKRAASEEFDWVADERVVSVTPDGTAEIEETLEDFAESGGSKSKDPEAEKLQQAILRSVERWSRPGRIVLRYRVTRLGLPLGLGREGVPILGEANPPLVTLWLLHALRPETALPNRPLRLGERWSEPHAVRLAEWSNVRAWESGQWLEPLNPSEAAARLLVSQQMTAAVAAGQEKPPQGSATARFSSEMLATVSLDDASLVQATRAAMREISWTLRPVAGLAKPPEFHLQVAAEVRIERCDGPCN